tara:strand:- start:847 stop:1644 length:798 start_codon:yes stop_codon:yes gene_type:complete
MKNFYVIGKPVAHSLSPKVFTYIFNKLNINAQYLSYSPINSIDFLKFINNNVDCFAGLNITLPYKVDAYNFIKERDKYSNVTNTINCINNINNNLKGHNTDYYGFMKMLDRIDLSNHEILVLGNGASARTVIYALSKRTNNNIYIWGRNIKKVQMLIDDMNINNVKLYSNILNNSYIVFNCLSIHINSNSIDNIIDHVLSSKLELFVDLNYIETLFTQRLVKKKYSVLLSLDMFIFQALKSFDIWFDNRYKNKITYNEIKNLLIK